MAARSGRGMENRDTALSPLATGGKWLAPRYGAMPLRFGSCFSTLDETLSVLRPSPPFFFLTFLSLLSVSFLSFFLFERRARTMPVSYDLFAGGDR